MLNWAWHAAKTKDDEFDNLLDSYISRLNKQLNPRVLGLIAC